MKNKRITNAATALLILINVGLFALIWLSFYNSFAFRTHRSEGALGAIAVYYIIYRWLSKLYRGYAFASTGVDEIVLSQFISFGIADLILYVASVLLRRNYVPVWPGAVTVLLQLLMTALVAGLAKRYLMRHIQPDRTLLIYGGRENEESARRFIGRLEEKYAHLFDVSRVLPDDADEARTTAAIDASDKVIFFGCAPEARARYIEYCMDSGRGFFFVPEFTDIVCAGCTVKNFLDTPLLRYDTTGARPASGVLKRLLDIVLSLLFLAILWPFMLITAVCILIEDGRPVIFRQERVTMDNRHFRIMKFRSMVKNAEDYGPLPATENDPRITKVGRVIRACRFDELPQLVNILLGHMSFVGPRPECIAHVDLYSEEVPEFKFRTAVKAGLTGYAQVYGKYNTSPEDKLKLDMLYIENQSLLLDFKLFLLTIKIIFRRESTEGFDQQRSRQINRQSGGSASRE
ncbi:MAG: exopolysaccharide biosynthesis polyprenyl glycosylphosphotransferase [Clostridia bacterium]|nr:exopolysaccharide biosynthesis polyprenyl glycosylphosphotransferase [Clostridia bacterium]